MGEAERVTSSPARDRTIAPGLQQLRVRVGRRPTVGPRLRPIVTQPRHLGEGECPVGLPAVEVGRRKTQKHRCCSSSSAKMRISRSATYAITRRRPADDCNARSCCRTPERSPCAAASIARMWGIAMLEGRSDRARASAVSSASPYRPSRPYAAPSDIAPSGERGSSRASCSSQSMPWSSIPSLISRSAVLLSRSLWFGAMASPAP
jgi:hypothetical protein